MSLQEPLVSRDDVRPRPGFDVLHEVEDAPNPLEDDVRMRDPIAGLRKGADAAVGYGANREQQGER